jgi:unsaturated rhamnogalacturonyl hydrolase
MYSKQQLNELLDKTVVVMTRRKKGGILVNAPVSIVDFDQWEWPQGVGLYGLFKHYQITGSPETLEYIIDWFERKLSGDLPGKNVNTMAPMLTLAYLYELTGNPRYRQYCEEWAEWVMKEMPRTQDHGLQHIVSGYENPQQLWDDTL